MHRHTGSLSFGLLFVSLLFHMPRLVIAEPPVVAGTVLITGLDTPWSVAVQPTTFNWFISEAGKGRIVRFNPDGKEKEPQPIITGFSVREYGDNPKYKIGPLGLAFLDMQTLVVGGGDQGPGGDLVRMYTLPTKDKEEKDKPLPLNVNDFKTDDTKPIGKLGPIAIGDKSKNNEGNFFGLVTTSNANTIFAIGQGSPDKGMILKADVVAGKPGELKPIFSTQSKETAAGFAMTLSPRGEIVVATGSEPNKPHSAKLIFFNRSGKKLLQVETGLNEITGVAYGKKTGYLYVTELSSQEPAAGGLYRLDQDGLDRAKPVKIAALDRPTALAFVPDGSAMIVTILGKYPADSPEKPGQAIKFLGL